MTQRIFERVRRIELQLGVPPSHYEPGAQRHRPAGHHRRAGRQPATEEREAVQAVSGGVTVDREGTVTGNTYDKYGSTNPVVRRLMAGFEGTLDELFAPRRPALAARRRLRRGRARPPVGAADAASGASSASTSTTRSCTAEWAEPPARRTSSTGS